MGRMQAPETAPVGVFDSGVGGLTILQSLRAELPYERFVYFGDTGNCPYGTRTEADIRQLAVQAANVLIRRGAKLIVVACNTASVVALGELRDTFTLPIVGVVPAIKPAAECTRTGRIGVAATEASANGTYLHRLIADHANGVQVLAAGCPDLVTLAESGVLEGPVAESAIERYIRPMLAAGIDRLVLGCTHFLAMRQAFERVAGPGVTIIDSGAAVARQTRRRLLESGLLAPETATAGRGDAAMTAREDEFWCSGDAAQFSQVAATILHEAVPARQTSDMVLHTE